jgi:hypothetical protein
MTTVPQVWPEAIDLPPVGTGERQRRRQERRRLGRQQMLVVLLMVVALVVTVAILAQQWLATGVAGGANQALHPARPGILVRANQSVPTKER